MYAVSVKIRGTAPLMQHRYPMPTFDQMSKGSKKTTGSSDYTTEWRSYFYSEPNADPGSEIMQPSTHIEGAMTKAAANFKIAGKRGKTYRDLFQSSVYVYPVMIPHGVKVPEFLDTDSAKSLYLDVRPVVIQRARVVRIRPTFAPGWKLEFEIQVLDDQVSDQVISEVLTYAGVSVGIGDFRPRFGRFLVEKFEIKR